MKPGASAQLGRTRTLGDQYGRFVRRAMAMPMLTRADEARLAARWRTHNDDAALHDLVRPHIRLVIATAKRYRRYGLPVADLVQEGNVGLMQAARRFDPGREVRFSTYAMWWIRAAMQEFVLRNWSIVRTGTTAAQKTLFFNLRRLRARIDPAGDGPLGAAARAEISRALDVPEHEVEGMAGRLSARDASLNTPVGEDGEAEWLDLLADPRANPERSAADNLIETRRGQLLAAALRRLDPRELMIVQRRQYQDRPSTLDALGRELGVSKERVRQLEQRALTKLRQALRRRLSRAEALSLI